MAKYMRLLVAAPRGFCAGVDRAIEIVEKCLKKFGKPEDLSGIIIFLCSNSSQFINGSNIVVDGGWSSW